MRDVAHDRDIQVCAFGTADFFTVEFCSQIGALRDVLGGSASRLSPNIGAH